MSFPLSSAFHHIMSYSNPLTFAIHIRSRINTLWYCALCDFYRSRSVIELTIESVVIQGWPREVLPFLCRQAGRQAGRRTERQTEMHTVRCNQLILIKPPSLMINQIKEDKKQLKENSFAPFFLLFIHQGREGSVSYGLWLMAYGLLLMAYGLWLMAYGLWLMTYGL